jgi:hypothetical protein
MSRQLSAILFWAVLLSSFLFCDTTFAASRKKIEVKKEFCPTNLASCAQCLVSGKTNAKTFKKDFKQMTCEAQKNIICQLGDSLFCESLNPQQRFTIAYALQKIFEYKKRVTKEKEELSNYEEQIKLITFIIAHLYPHPLYAALEHIKTDIVQTCVKKYPSCLNIPITLPARENSVCGTMLDHLKTILAKEKEQIQYLSPVSVRDEFEAKKYNEMKERVVALESLLQTLHAAGAQSMQDFNKKDK